MKKRYLLFASLSYSFGILRPIQEEIWRRGGEAAWFLEATCENELKEGEKQLHTIEEIREYDPIAVFVPGNHVYDFIPGVKVQVFHGYPLNKRADKVDDHFTIRGWFDVYCTQGANSTPYFKELEEQHGSFKVYETGWPKVDSLFEGAEKTKNERPKIIYSSTFTQRITSLYDLYETIEELVESKPWDWIVTFHPAMRDREILDKYMALIERSPNMVYYPNNKLVDGLKEADAMLCDTSSVTLEMQLLDKPVVTYRNTHPGPYFIDVTEREEVGDALERALTRPKELMDIAREYTYEFESYRDGRNSARVLDAVDDFVENYQGKLKKKRPGLFRKWKIRRMARKQGLKV